MHALHVLCRQLNIKLVAIDITLHLVLGLYNFLSFDFDLIFDPELTSLKFMQPGSVDYPISMQETIIIET